MPDVADVPHVWFIPVTGGRGYSAAAMDPFRRVPIEPFNVQWEFTRFPTQQPEPPVDESCVQACAITTATMGSEAGDPDDLPSKLLQCYGSWKWRSCRDAAGSIIVGGQLAVGTVFTRQVNMYVDGDPTPVPDIPPVNTWEKVETWVKFRVSTTATLSAIYFTINDMSGNVIGLNAVPRNWLALVAPNTWFVGHAWKSGAWAPDPNWDDTNLRAVLSVQGTTVGANAGPVTVDVEWFAFRLIETD